MVAGADSIDDMALLRHGAMGTVFDRPYAPSTLGSFLREFSFGHGALPPCVGHAQSRDVPGRSEMIQSDGKEKLFRRVQG
jgi:hypothetical protein